MFTGADFWEDSFFRESLDGLTCLQNVLGEASVGCLSVIVMCSL